MCGVAGRQLKIRFTKTHAEMESKKNTRQFGRGRNGGNNVTRTQTRRLSVTNNGRHDVCG